jgi:hypothetical protein
MAEIVGGVTSVGVEGFDISDNLMRVDPADPVTCELCGALVARNDRDHDVADITKLGDTKASIFVARCNKQ